MQTDSPARTLSPIEARIVGALIEKALTTPEYYPLTLNALIAACNQKNNRAPLMALDERTLQNGLYSLQEKRLAECFSGATSRTVKYRERLIAEFELGPAERALLCELLLRGPQTPGELRSRAARMHPFASLDEIMAALRRLAAREDGALVTELPRQPGHKEARGFDESCGLMYSNDMWRHHPQSRACKPSPNAIARPSSALLPPQSRPTANRILTLFEGVSPAADLLLY